MRPRPGCSCARSPRAPCRVAPRLPVYEELLGDGERGLLFEPGDVETLAAQLERLVADDALRARLRRRRRRPRERLTWERVADELEDVYAALAARRHARRRRPGAAPRGWPAAG